MFVEGDSRRKAFPSLTSSSIFVSMSDAGDARRLGKNEVWSRKGKVWDDELSFREWELLWGESGGFRASPLSWVWSLRNRFKAKSLTNSDDTMMRAAACWNFKLNNELLRQRFEGEQCLSLLSNACLLRRYINGSIIPCSGTNRTL